MGKKREDYTNSMFDPVHYSHRKSISIDGVAPRPK